MKMTGRLSRRLSRIEAEAQARESRRGEIDGALLAALRGLWARHGYEYVPTIAEIDGALLAYETGPVRLRELLDEELRALILIRTAFQAGGGEDGRQV
jgi:hypothetical protein